MSGILQSQLKDLDESQNFYCDFLGFTLIGKDENHNKKQIFITTPGGNLTIELFIENETVNSKIPDHIAFECIDIASFFELVKSKNPQAVNKLNTYDNGVRFFSVTDPNNIPLHLFRVRKFMKIRSYQTKVTFVVNQSGPKSSTKLPLTYFVIFLSMNKLQI